MKKVLIFLIACLASTTMFAQLHYVVNSTGCGPMNTKLAVILVIDGVEIKNPNLEMGAFDQDGICRGAKMPTYRAATDQYIFTLQLKGIEGTTVYTDFKVWDHENDVELDIVYTGPTDEYYYQGNYTYSTTGAPIYHPFHDPNGDISMANDATDNAETIEDNDGKTANVTLSGRTLYKDGAWNTLTLPFDMTEEQVAAQLDPLELMELSNDVTETFNNHPTGVTDDGTLYLVFKDVTEITAGRPYIIKWEGDGSDNLVDPVFTGVTIDNASLEDNAVTFDGGKFIGTYTFTEYIEDNPSIFFLGNDGLTLYWPKQGATLGAFRAYFQMDEGTKIRSFRVSYGQDGGEATGIVSAKVSDDARDNWYSVDGVKLNGAPKRKGLYIHNGTKVVIK